MSKLGEKSVGSIVKLNVGGTATDFIVVHQGLPSSDYDSSCDGTWLLMKDVWSGYSKGWSADEFPDSLLYDRLNLTTSSSYFMRQLDEDIRSAIPEVKLPYLQVKNEDSFTVMTGANGFSAKVFILSATEFGFEVGNSSGTQYLTEGAVLDYFNTTDYSRRVGYLNGSGVPIWTRSPQNYYGTNVWGVYASYYGQQAGYIGSMAYSNTNTYMRPALILPADFGVESDGTIVIGSAIGHSNIGSTWKENANGYANIGGIWKEIVAGYVNIGGIWKEM